MRGIITTGLFVLTAAAASAHGSGPPATSRPPAARHLVGPRSDHAWPRQVDHLMAAFERQEVDTVLRRLAEAGVGIMVGPPVLDVRFDGAMAGDLEYRGTLTRSLTFRYQYSRTEAEHIVNRHLSFTETARTASGAEGVLRDYCERSCREPGIHDAWAGKNCRPYGPVQREGRHFWQECEVWEARPDICMAPGGTSIHPVAGCDYKTATVSGTYSSAFVCALEERWHCRVQNTLTQCATHDEAAPTFSAEKDFCHYHMAALWERPDDPNEPVAALPAVQRRHLHLEQLLDQLYQP